MVTDFINKLKHYQITIPKSLHKKVSKAGKKQQLNRRDNTKLLYVYYMKLAYDITKENIIYTIICMII